MRTKKKNWIAAAVGKHPGALHRQLHVSADRNIPVKTLRRAANAGGVKGRRARLAITLKGLNKGKTKPKKKKFLPAAQNFLGKVGQNIKQGVKDIAHLKPSDLLAGAKHVMTPTPIGTIGRGIKHALGLASKKKAIKKHKTKPKMVACKMCKSKAHTTASHGK